MFSLIGVYGGTFDPIHYGHLRLAEELVGVLSFQILHFVPSGSPRLRSAPSASKYHRDAMLRAAIQGNPKFVTDAREIVLSGDSYSVVTLRELKDEIPGNSALCFIMGADVFTHFSKWYCWREILNLCHLVIVDRPGYASINNNSTLSQDLKREFMQRQVACIDALRKLSNGCIFIAPTTLLDISSTTIRSYLSADKSARYLLPDTVLKYITINQLYSSGVK